jgi:DNA replication and repair protein RecF
MKILAARICNFRNLEETALSFSPQVNLFLGGNGQGKTNLLEALNYVSLGRSHRGSRDADLIHFEAEHLHVEINTETDKGNRIDFQYALQRERGRRFRVGGQPVGRRLDLIGRLQTVFFSPDTISLIRGGPEKRRRFVDRGIAGLDPDYLTHLQAYLRAARQKARLLRELNGLVGPNPGALREVGSWNRKMSVHAAVICQRRREYAAQLTPSAAPIYSRLTGELPSLELVYLPSLAAAKNPPENRDFQKDILAELDYIIRDETRRGRPLSGPQMDDFKVRLGGLDVRTYGSQGETRTAAISFILAQSDVLFRLKQVRPVLFFDDIFSELDRKRSRRLQEESSRDHQVFIATARVEDVAEWQPLGLKVWEIDRGRVKCVS